MRQLGSWILAAILAAVVGGIAYSISNGNLLVASIFALLAAGIAILTSILAFSKQLLEPVKLYFESKKLYWESEEKRRNVEDRDRRVILPSKTEVREYGAQYRELKKDLLASYSKESRPLPTHSFVASDQEAKKKNSVDDH